eukprot:998717-Pleurochrysis_carterae.AAC.3
MKRASCSAGTLSVSALVTPMVCSERHGTHRRRRRGRRPATPPQSSLSRSLRHPATRRTRCRRRPSSASSAGPAPAALAPWAPSLLQLLRLYRQRGPPRERRVGAGRQHGLRVACSQREGVRAFALADCHYSCQPLNAILQQRFHEQRLCAARGRLRHPQIYPALRRRTAARDIAAVRVDDAPVAKFE